MSYPSSGPLPFRSHARAGAATAPALDAAAGKLPLLRRLRGQRAPRRRPEWDGLQQLENRILLGGDHPSFGQFPAATDLMLLNGRAEMPGVIGTVNDDDVFRFVAPPGSSLVTVLADTRNQPGNVGLPSGLDSRIRILDSAGQQIGQWGTNNGILSSTRPGVATDGWFGFIATPGQTYYINVAGESNTTGGYIVRVNAATADIPITVDPVVPAGDFDTREAKTRGEGMIPDNTRFGFAAQNPPAPGAQLLLFPQDELLYRVTAPDNPIFDSLATATARAARAGAGVGPGGPVDTHLEIYAAGPDGVQLVQVASDIETGFLNDAFAVWRSTPGATFYVRVRGDDLRNPANFPSTGEFQIRVNLAAEVFLNPVSEISRRGSLMPPGLDEDPTNPALNLIRNSADSQVFTFQAIWTGLTFISAIPIGLPHDLALRLYDSSGNLIGFNNDFSGTNPRIEINLVGGETYYIVVDGFPDAASGRFNVFIEAAHGLDDHINVPNFGLATPLRFSDATFLFDSDNLGPRNPLYDRGYVQHASGTGRIHPATDSDLFMFIPPVDMLGQYTGNNDDVGAGLFVGGGFSTADPDSAYPRVSGPLGTWDAGDWWFNWRQGEGPDGIQYGFLPRPGSPLGRPEIYVMQEFDPDGPGTFWRPSLFIGGDFLLRLPSPFGPIEHQNLAILRARPTGHTWEGLAASPNAPVRAMTVFDPDGPALPRLIIGGDFTAFGSAELLRVAQFSAFIGLAPLGGGIDIDGASVRALAAFDPEDPGEARPENPGPPFLPGVPDVPDPPTTLYIGGSINGNQALFTSWNGVRYLNPGVGVDVDPDDPIDIVGSSINAMAVYTPPGDDATPRLIIAGSFTSIDGVEALNIIQFGGVFDTDPQDPGYAPALLFEPLEGIPGSGVGIVGTDNQGLPVVVGGAVHALAVWDPADVFGGGDNAIPPQLIIGGDFNAIVDELDDDGRPIFIGAANLAFWEGDLIDELLGTDGPVFALTISRTADGTIDDQEPGIPQLPGSLNPQEVLYVGGNFELGFGDTRNTVGPFVLQAAWEIDPFFGPVLNFQRLNTGVDGPVFALSMYDDQNPLHDNSAGQWDRNDRPGTRAQLILSPADDGFLNTGLRIYDSNGVLIYPTGGGGPFHGTPPLPPGAPPANNTIAPPFQDPAGALDPSRGPGTPTEITMPPMWGGEVYFIEIVSFGGTGRYNFTLTVDAVPLDVTGNGIPNDPRGTFFETLNASEGNFPTAAVLPITLATGAATNFIPQFNAAYDGMTFRATPSGISITQRNELGIIHRPDDTDLYTFIAEETGTAEVRINTRDIRRNPNDPLDTDGDSFYERIFDNIQGSLISEEEVFRVYQSLLQGAIRIFNNDFEEIAFNAGFAGVNSFADVYTAGMFTRTFTRTDPRVVFNVIRGEKYFIQVESGQRAAFAEDPDLVDWRRATGSYELLVNTMPSMNFDDDHSNVIFPGSPFRFPTPIRIGDRTPELLAEPLNGRGSILGEIRNTLANPIDIDLFQFISIANGPISLTVTATNPPQGLRASVVVTNRFGLTVAQGGASVGGNVTVNWVAQQGEPFMIRIEGAGTQGNYRLDVNAAPFVDDHADWWEWTEATPLVVNRFFGTARVVGTLEFASDTDLFVYTAESFEVATVSVEPNGPNFDPLLLVYEQNLDGAGLPVFQLVGLDNTLPNSGIRNRLQFAVNPDRPYFFVVFAGATQRGSYTLTLDVTPTDDHPNFSDRPTATEIEVVYDTVLGTGTGSITGIIERPTDDDLFVFTAPTDGDATITIATPDSGLAPRVELRSAAQPLQIIAAADGIAGTASVTVVAQLIAGQQYYIVVRPGPTGVDQPDDVGAYTVSILTSPSDDLPDDGQFTLAQNFEVQLNTFTGIGTLSGVILPFTDTDLVSFRALAAGQVTVELTTPASGLAPFIRIYRDGAPPAVVLEQAGDGDAVTVTFTADAPGQRFYIMVASAPGSVGQQLTGAFTIRVLSPLGTGGGPGGQDDDHPNAGSWSTASVIALDSRNGNGARSGIIEFFGDTDLFRFTTFAGGPIHVHLTTPQGSPLDASVRIFNSNLQQIAFNSLGIPGATAAVTFQATGVETFFVLVEQVGPNLGGYNVVVNTSPSTHFLYYPEGFSGSTIDEFIPIVNPNNFDVTYTIIARYEVGQRDQVLQTGVIGANSRGGITVSTKAGENPHNVRIGTPYALEIQSTGQLGATLSHYDFGTTTGESFTDRISTLWTFSEARRSSSFRDFLVFYNPTNTAANVDITLIYQDGSVTTFSRTVEALRRGGVNFAEDLEITKNGVFAIEVRSNVGIVAALSSYDVQNQRGFGLLGNPDGGATKGVVPSITTGSGVESGLSIFNSGNTTATVTIRVSYQRVDLPDLVRVITVGARSRVGMSMVELGLVADQVAGLRYSSNVPVTLTAFEYRRGDGNATSANTDAFTRALIGDAFVNPAVAGVTYVEELALYNPANIDVNVTIRFLFSDGTTGQYVDPATGGNTINLASDRFATIRIDQQPAILNRPGLAFFSIVIEAPTPITAAFTHYDLFLDGGWGTQPSIVGIPTRISRI